MLPTSTLCERVRGAESHRTSQTSLLASQESMSSTLIIGTGILIPPQALLAEASSFSGSKWRLFAFGMVSGGGLVLILGDDAGEMLGDVTGEGVLDESEEEGVMVAPVGDNVSDRLLARVALFFRDVKNMR